MSRINEQSYQPGFINDVHSLDSLRQGAQKNDDAAMNAAARQFESIFTQKMYQSMRDANQHFKSGVFDSRQSSFFEDMRDQQMSTELSANGSLGLADMIVAQTKLATTDLEQPAAETALLQKPQQPFSLEPALPETTLVRDSKQPVEKSKKESAEFAQLVKAIKMQRQGPEVVIGVSSASAIASAKNKNAEVFVQNMAPYAQKTAKELGVDPEVLIAQAALETGWGKSVIHKNGQSSHNLFNIKADRRWDGNKMNMLTKEVYNGVAVKERADFRAYESYQHSFDDYVKFLKSNPRYKNALATNNSKSYVKELHKAGYATDPHYSNKILAIADRIKVMMK